MPAHTRLPHCVTIDRPMVLVPVEEYKELLEEAGYTKTPKLDKEIAVARAHFRKGKTIALSHLPNNKRLPIFLIFSRGRKSLCPFLLLDSPPVF